MSATRASPRSSARAASAACRSSSCEPNPRNPRRNFADAELDELAPSIRERGIIQPIVVRRCAARATLRDHRRRAALARGAARRPARRAGGACSRSSDGEALELAIIENVQRADLNRAGRGARLSGARRRVQVQPGRHRADRRQEPQPCRQHAAAAEAAGRRAGAVSRDGKLSAGHARALLGQPDPEALASEIVAQGLNVRQVEAIAQEQRRKARARSQDAPARRQGCRHGALEKRAVGRARPGGQIDHRGKGGGCRSATRRSSSSTT